MARRRVNVFSLSFLDVMSCGFGAVVLIFLIINHATEEETKTVNKDLLSEVRLLDYQVQNGERDLFELLERMDSLSQRISESDQKMVSSRELLEKRREDFETLSAESLVNGRVEVIETSLISGHGPAVLLLGAQPVEFQFPG